MMIHLYKFFPHRDLYGRFSTGIRDSISLCSSSPTPGHHPSPPLSRCSRTPCPCVVYPTFACGTVAAHMDPASPLWWPMWIQRAHSSGPCGVVLIAADGMSNAAVDCCNSWGRRSGRRKTKKSTREWTVHGSKYKNGLRHSITLLRMGFLIFAL